MKALGMRSRLPLAGKLSCLFFSNTDTYNYSNNSLIARYPCLTVSTRSSLSRSFPAIFDEQYSRHYVNSHSTDHTIPGGIKSQQLD